MKLNSNDTTKDKLIVSKWMHLFAEYEIVKRGKHEHFKLVGQFYKAHRTNRQTFSKYYNRYLQDQSFESLLPKRRGPKWKSRRVLPEIEQKVVEQRQKGINKYEIYAILKPILKEKTPSPSTIYRISKRNNLNKLNVKMKEEKRKIIKEKLGELGHLDCHYLSKDLIIGDGKRYYLLGLIDDASRIAWVEVIDRLTSLDAMFATLKSINLLKAEYGIKFKEIMTDNGSEFASKNNILEHPVERLFFELGVKHVYTRPYRPQTNGKIERFWRTLNQDLIDYTTFDSLDQFKNELNQYLQYYNNLRPHQSLNGQTPNSYV
ncbi:MAG: integrase core domain-containing protein [Alphaproteobacteria bacterium]|jgi:transposase InsO family protein